MSWGISSHIWLTSRADILFLGRFAIGYPWVCQLQLELTDSSIMLLSFWYVSDIHIRSKQIVFLHLSVVAQYHRLLLAIKLGSTRCLWIWHFLLKSYFSWQMGWGHQTVWLRNRWLCQIILYCNDQIMKIITFLVEINAIFMITFYFFKH